MGSTKAVIDPNGLLVRSTGMSQRTGTSKAATDVEDVRGDHPTDLRQQARRWSETLRATREARSSRDIALLAARVGLAWIFIYHGAGTLFGAFGGSGLHTQALYFAHTAHLQPGTLFAVLSGIVECFGGAAVGFGILGRLAALGLVGDMGIAMITVTFGHGIIGNSAGSGYELNIALAALALVVAIMGTGRFSLDAAVEHLIKGEGRQTPLRTG
jgi:putative oxidoreductase